MRPLGQGLAAKVTGDQIPDGPRYSGLLQSIMLMRFRHQWVPRLRRKYGDVFSIKILPEGRWMVFFHKPEHVREIFAGDPEVFHAGKGNAILGPVMGEHSLLLVDSSQHKRARKLLMPAFNGHALRSYESMIEGLTKTEVGSWREGQAFESLERMNALTLEVILQVVFGVTDEARLAEMRPLVNKTVNVSPAVFLGWGFPKMQKLGPWRRAFENQAALDKVIYAEIAERRRAEDLEHRTDVLSRLLMVRDEEDPADTGLSDEELRDQLVTLLLAGHETTATALAWALHELGQNPDVEQRAREAATAGDNDYLEAVLKESMRLHPVIPMVVRHLMEPATIGGIDLPAGANVAASIILAHESEESHPDHLAFRPERFADGAVATNTWIPFGGGVRRCIGAGFSIMEGVAVLREVLSAYDVSLPPGTKEEAKVRNITSVPKNGAKIIVTRR
ncbi:cytochrome P450 [Nocardioides marmoriginsengisoli]|uniref:Cytochrome P450 n=2 Tax=Nocardioides marmoriginsengisoli TaxID=661483 RepID=A0A3N0CC14_9ACTN|nr:cytochrome P450 [Nocardioides marmoriginsengisoli]